MSYLLIVWPLLMAGVTFAMPSDRRRPWLLPLGALGHLGLVWWAILQPAGSPALSELGGWLLLDALGKVVLGFLAVLFLLCSLYAPGYLALRSDRPNRVFCANLFLAYASLKAGLEPTLLFDQLIKDAPYLSPPWLHAAFVLLFIGYGTKMGLAPMHTWKPDAYGEAPGLVGALLAGGVTSCAFLAILRVYQICHAGPEADFARGLMIGMGLLSMAVAAVFMVRQRDIKRLLAYSSVEHMGILVLGIGIGGLAVYGALLHLINNGLTKGVLFLSAGNMHRAYGSKLTDDVRGALKRVPLSGALFLAGFLAITGSPPFGPFVSEFTIVNGALGSGQFVAAGLFLLLLGIAFIGMGSTVLAVVQGTPTDSKEPHVFRDGVSTGAPIVLFMGLVLLLGLYVPPALESLLQQAAALVEVKR